MVGAPVAQSENEGPDARATTKSDVYLTWSMMLVENRFTLYGIML
jgi:hypothetical protein